LLIVGADCWLSAACEQAVQSAGAAISWKLNASGMTSNGQLAVCWILFISCVLPTLSVVNGLSSIPVSSSVKQEGGNGDHDGDTLPLNGEQEMSPIHS
jgi:hypothetical protein